MTVRFLIALLLSWPIAPVARAAATDPLDDAVRAFMRETHTPGVAVAVIRDGKPVTGRGWGLANVEWSQPASETTVYELMSVGKQFTAAAVVRLVEQGKVRLDDPIGAYLKDAPAAWRAATVRQLLAHTAGIPEYTNAPGFWNTIRLDTAPWDVIKPVAERPLDFASGSKWSYSNTGYFLLGLMIETVSGQPYSAFLAHEIFSPLGMTATRVNDMRDIVPMRAAGYAWTRDGLRNEEYVSPTQKWAAGAVVSTASDLARWEIAVASTNLLKAESWRDMQAAAQLADGNAAPYGFGNELSVDHGHRVAGHQGGALGFDATILRFPDDRLSVIVLANLRGADTRRLARRIAMSYLPDLSDAGKSGVDDPDPALTNKLETILSAAAQGEVDESLFSSRGQADAVPIIRRVGPRFLGPRGELHALTLLETTPHPNGRTLRYRASYSSSTLVWTIDVDDAGLINAMEPQEE